MWNWLSLVFAGLLLLGAGQTSGALFIGIWLLALGCLAFGIISSLRPDESPNTRLTFARFQTSTSKKPWCVETRYAIAYAFNGEPTQPSTTTAVNPSLTHTDPVLTVSAPGPQVDVMWYRGLPPAFQMLPYDGMELLATGNRLEFVDKNNPCDIPFVPDPPPPPTAGGGQFGAWNVRAGPDELPWCVATRYRAQYVGGPNGAESLPSGPSLPFQSDEYSHPTMSVPARAGYDVKWTSELMPDDWRITLPCTEVNNVCHPGGAIVLVAPGGTMVGNVDFSDVWTPGSPTLTLHIRDFVALWNLKVERTNIGTLRVREDGRLEMSAMQTASAADITVMPAGQLWWQSMGFGLTGLRTNEPMVADAIPYLQRSSVGSNVFIDVLNKCTA
jgi:hypothetical protein